MIKRLLLRALRSAATTGAAVLASKIAADPRFLIVAPVLAALGKALRDRWPKYGDLIPF